MIDIYTVSCVWLLGVAMTILELLTVLLTSFLHSLMGLKHCKVAGVLLSCHTDLW